MLAIPPIAARIPLEGTKIVLGGLREAVGRASNPARRREWGEY